MFGCVCICEYTCEVLGVGVRVLSVETKDTMSLYLQVSVL